MPIANFDPAPAFQGGVLIAVAALVFLVVANKRTGISGLLGSGLLRAVKGEALDRVASTFVGAFLVAALCCRAGAATKGPPAVPLALPVYVLSGALTGFGADVLRCVTMYAIDSRETDTQNPIIPTRDATGEWVHVWPWCVRADAPE